MQRSSWAFDHLYIAIGWVIEVSDASGSGHDHDQSVSAFPQTDAQPYARPDPVDQG